MLRHSLQGVDVHDGTLISTGLPAIRASCVANNWRDDRCVVPNLRRALPILPTSVLCLCLGRDSARPSRLYHCKTFISPWYGQSSDLATCPARTGFSTTYCHF